MKNKKLVIISHTEHYLNENGALVGWGSTVNEINYLADHWNEIVHVACLYEQEAPASALPYLKLNVGFVKLPPFGGKTLKSKILIITKLPKIIQQVNNALQDASEVQLRLPTSIGLFLLPLFAFYWPRKFVFWVKYAGNWNQSKAPLSYRIQKWFLIKNYAKCKVTINGFWINQPTHCISFENPCLTHEDVENGEAMHKEKDFVSPFVFCFIGRLDENKGMQYVKEALSSIPIQKIKEVHFVGDGPNIEMYKSQFSFLQEKVIFHGFLPQDEVHDVLKKSNFLLLPSKSEGFPKVIAEAACYATIPIVSNVGSVPHYINKTNGFVFDINTQNYSETMNKALLTPTPTLKKIAIDLFPLAKKFTFANYLHKLKVEIFNSKK
ncbi:glycosyltransferase [uncultured Flavobacterium sp.]|uniref:glycosyltransferase n=1 Tax=uncultured Flavobacterium sp. TaxID=165435 RepID=UPI0030ECD331|tara:strand:- start:4960 stop:6099 length:1140 start_codon:yes stop_codon:yes gene_type:complete